MSSSSISSIPTRRKRTISERVTGNSDPLVVRKKAREAAKKASKAVTSTKKVTQVRFFSLKILKILSPFFNPLLT